jgi:hypothetical protein
VPALVAHDLARADAAGWAALSPAARAEAEAAARSGAGHVRRDAQLAHGAAKVLRALARLRPSELLNEPALRARVPALINFAIGVLAGARLTGLSVTLIPTLIPTLTLTPTLTLILTLTQP